MVILVVFEAVNWSIVKTVHSRRLEYCSPDSMLMLIAIFVRALPGNEMRSRLISQRSHGSHLDCGGFVNGGGLLI